MLYFFIFTKRTQFIYLFMPGIHQKTHLMEKVMRKIILGISSIGLITSFNQGYAMQENEAEESQNETHPASTPPKDGESPIQGIPRELLEEIIGGNEERLSNKKLAERATISQGVKKAIDPILDRRFRAAISRPVFIDLELAKDRTYLLKLLRKAKAVSDRNLNNPARLKLTMLKLEQQAWDQFKQLIDQEDPSYLDYIDGLSIHNIASDDDITALITTIPTIRNLNELNLSITIASEDTKGSYVEKLVEKLKNNKSITNLILTCPNVNNRVEKALATLIEDNKTLKALELRIGKRNTIDTEYPLEEALKKNNTLKVLNLYYHQIEDAKINALSEMLKENNTLTTLILRGGHVNDSQALNLAEALRKNDTLTNLEISSNAIGDVGANALAEMLKDNKTLTNLDLSRNKIGDAGANGFAEMLKDNQTLTNLVLSSNKIGDAGASSLLEALKKNSTLKILNLEYNDAITKETKDNLKKADERIIIKSTPTYIPI